MPHFREFIDPNFLCNLDFLNDQGQYCRKIVTIKDVTKEEVHNGRGGTEIVATVHTVETKPFILTPRNMKTIITLLKKVNTDAWKLQKIELYISENQKHFGQMWDVITVSKAKPAPAKPIDYTKQETMLRNCLTLKELRAAFTSLSPAERSAMVNLKDELKKTLPA